MRHPAHIDAVYLLHVDAASPSRRVNWGLGEGTEKLRWLRSDGLGRTKDGGASSSVGKRDILRLEQKRR